MILAIVFPVVFILVTGLLAGGPKEPIGLVHPSERLVSLAERSGYVSIKIEPNRAALGDDILRSRVVAGVVTLPARPGAISVQFVSESAQSDALQARTDVVALLNLLSAEGPYVGVTNVTLANTHVTAPLSPFAYVAPADLVLFLGITLLVLSSSLVESRRLGILRRLTAAPVSRAAIVAAEIASRMMVAAGQAVGLLFVGVVLFRVHWGNPFAVFLVVFFLALSFSGASVLIGTASRTEEQATALAIVIGIATGMLGGCLYPLDVVGPAVRAVGHLVPQAWAMDGFIKLIYHGASFADVLPEIAALAGFAVLFTTLAVWRYDATMYSPG